MKKRVFLPVLAAFTLFAAACTDYKSQMDQLQKDYDAISGRTVDVAPAADVTAPAADVFAVSFDKAGYGVDAAGSVTLRYSLPADAKVEVSARDGWSASVSPADGRSGEITVTAPDPASPSDIVITATASDGRRTAATLPIIVRDPYTDATRTDIPAMGYFCFNAQLATDEHFRKMAACGMNMLTIESSDNWLQQLDLAQKYGLKGVLFVNGPAQDYYRDRSDTKLSDIIAVAKNHPALAGYQVFDEPHLRYMDQMKVAKARIKELDPDHPVYINIGPSNASEETYGVKEFEDYVETIVSGCELEFISFDQYPVYQGHLDPSWPKTLDIIFKIAKKYGIPIWAFTLCCREWFREDPTLENIRLQCNVNLAYGAQVNQFFVYRATSGTNLAPLMNDGTYTVAYDYCQQYCSEMHKRGYVFAGCNVKQLRGNIFFGNYLQTFNSADLPPQINAMKLGGEALVSLIENRGNEYLVVVNGSWQGRCSIEAGFDDIVYSIDHDGKFTEHPGGSQASFVLEGGDMMVFKYR